MVNNRGKWLFCIFIFFLCLTLSIFLLNTAPLSADLPPLDSGNLPFSPLPGAYSPQGVGFLPQYGTPYGATSGYGLPYQNMRPGYMLPTGQFGLQSPFGTPYQTMGYNPLAAAYPYAAANPYLATNPYLLASSDTYNASSSLPPYDTMYNASYNASSFPNQAFYGPMQNMFAPSNVYQQYPVGSPYAINPLQRNVNPYANQFAGLYGNTTPYSGLLQQQGFLGAYNNMGTSYNPFLPINMLQQNRSPYGINISPYINPYSQFNTYNPYNPYNPYQYNASNYYPNTGGNSSSGGSGGSSTPVDLPNAKGYWSGTWEAWLTDPNEGVVTDPNGVIQITMSGDIRFHVTKQDADGGAVEGTIEISGWDVDPEPDDWPGNWDGESDEVELTGWIDAATRYLKARYFYYPGKEDSGEYAAGEDPQNIKGLYTWYFNTNKLTITDTGISGQFSVTGTAGYYVIGVFRTAKYTPN